MSGPIYFFKVFIIIIIFILAALGLRSGARRSGHPFLQSPGSGAQGRQLRLGLGCPVACGMLVPDQGSKLCPLHGKMDSIDPRILEMVNEHWLQLQVISCISP